MPVDSRRIPAPEKSFDPDLFSTATQAAVLVDQDRKRHDGRLPDETRQMFLKAAVTSQAKGSAYLELGKTKVMCAVYGPRDIGKREEFQMKGILKCEFKFAPFSCKQRRSHIRDSQELEYSQILTQALEPAVCLSKFPKSEVDVIVTVLENDGSALAGGIMAASLALTDASIEMFDMVTAFSIQQTGKDLVLHDPTAFEESEPSVCQNRLVNHGNVVVALLPVLNQVSAVVSHGALDCSVLSAAVRNCASGAQCVYPVMQKAVTDSVHHSIQLPFDSN